jgi:hypothetical protein
LKDVTMANGAQQDLEAAFMQRDALMTLLLAQCHEQLQHLALLAGHEKSAVCMLMLVGQAMGVYLYGPRADREVYGVFERVASGLSPATGRALGGLFPRGETQWEDVLATVQQQSQQLRQLLAMVAPGEPVFHRAGESRSLPSGR